MAKNNIEIPRLILDHLLHYGNTSILGLGTLYYEYRSAYFANDKSEIFPPSAVVKYKDAVGNTDLFAHYVASRMGITPVEALEKIDAYAQDLLNSLLNYGKVEIPAVGTFTKVEGKDILFTESAGEVNANYFGLPAVKLKPIQYFKKGEANQNEMAISTADMPARTKSAPIVETSTAQTPVYNYNDEDDSNWLRPLLWILGLVLLFAVLYQGCKKYMNQDTNSPPVLVEGEGLDSTDQDVKVIDPSEEIVTGEKPTDSSDAVDKIETKTPTECVIILGAFESARNAMKMSSKISSLGYQPYEEYFDTMDLTRVGFKFECGDKDLREFIYEVRKDIAPDAWYLVPRITVE